MAANPKQATRSDPVFATADAVSDHALEVTRRAYLARDFEQFSERFLLPQIVGTFEGEEKIETLEDLRVLFDAMLANMDQLGVIDLKRNTVCAEFLAPDLVQATFVSQYVLPGYALSDEVVAHGQLCWHDGLWKIQESRYATPMEAVSRALLQRADRKDPK